MARMKIETTAAMSSAHGVTTHQKLIAHLPRFAPHASRLSWISNLLSKSSTIRTVLEPVTQLSRYRPLPEWNRNPFLQSQSVGPSDGKPVVLFADTFNKWFEPANLRAAVSVLIAAGYRIHFPVSDNSRRPLCCGRTYLTNGLIDEAELEINRLLTAVEPYLKQGIPIVGLEPSCLLGLRDEIPQLVRSDVSESLSQISFLFEEFLDRENPDLKLKPIDRIALVHGHCHQKSFDQMSFVESALARIPELKSSVIDSGCCGMAGAFGYGRDTWRVSTKMAELDLLPTIREAKEDTIIVADGTSCRHQIELGTGRQSIHVAQLLDSALQSGD